jgi:hypothetical protein
MMKSVELTTDFDMEIREAFKVYIHTNIHAYTYTLQCNHCDTCGLLGALALWLCLMLLIYFKQAADSTTV